MNQIIEFQTNPHIGSNEQNMFTKNKQAQMYLSLKSIGHTIFTKYIIYCIKFKIDVNVVKPET